MIFKLNHDQSKILEELKDFVFNTSNKHKLYLLTGLAGTGKTFLISYFLNLPDFKNKKIAITGCTNKAVGVLENSFINIIKNNNNDKNDDVKGKDSDKDSDKYNVNVNDNINENQNQNENRWYDGEVDNIDHMYRMDNMDHIDEEYNESEKVTPKNINSNTNTNTNTNIKTDNKQVIFMTIHKLLQIKRNIDSTGQENFISLIDENNIKPSEHSIFYYDLIIVDEVSMLNKDLTLKLLLLQKKIKGKIIFLGDKAQLPPVNEVESHIFELAGTHIPQNSLQKIMRSGDQIINFVNSIRILIDNHNHKVPFTKLASAVSDGDTISRISLFRNEEEWVKKYLENNSETDQIILCYTNKRVDFLNKKIRKALYKTEKNDFVDGEKIIFNNFYNLNINKVKYYSSQMMKIKSSIFDSITIRGFNLYDILNIRFPTKLLDSNLKSFNNNIKIKIPSVPMDPYLIENGNSYKIGDNMCMLCYQVKKNIIGNNTDNHKPRNDDFVYNICGHHYCVKCYDSWGNKTTSYTCPFCVFSIDKIKNSDGNIIINDEERLHYFINMLRNSYKNKKYKVWLIMLDNNDIINVIHQDDREKYNKDIENIKNYLRDINTYITKKYLPKEHYWKKVLLKLWEFYYYYFIDQFADISYGNAITTHRSQGSTYKRVYVDLIDIIKCNDAKKEAFQCLYTAVTRASEHLEILF